MKTFPFIFGRVGGANLNTLQEISTEQIRHDASILNIRSKIIEVLKNDLVNRLHNLIGRTKDNKIQNRLLNFKRALHNNKSLQKFEDLTLAYCDTTFEDLLEQYQHKKNEFVKLEQGFKKNFNIALLETASRFHSIANRCFLKNGLLFSSDLLSKKASENNFKFSSLNKKNKKLLLSLTRYLTRSVSKTTPFSTFNSIFCLENTGENYVPLKSEHPSNIQINNLLFHYIETYLQTEPTLRYRLPLKVNDNIQIKENKLTYFTNLKNNEYFKRISLSELLNYLISNYKDETIEFELLVKDLSNKLKEDKENVRTYLDTLVNEGFFLFNLQITCHYENWCTELINFIKSVNKTDKIPALENLEQLLIKLHITKNQLSNSIDIEERKSIIKTIYEQVKSYFKEYAPTSDLLGKIHAQDLFYEDTAISLNDTLATQNIDELIDELRNLRNHFRFFDSKKIINRRLVNLFVSKYKNAHKISLLEFYEKIYLKEFEKHNFLQSDLAQFNQVLDTFQKHLISSEEEVELDLQHYINVTTENSNDAFGVYLQDCDHQFQKVIINNLTSGNSKNISRFFNLFPEEKAISAKAFLERQYTGKTLVDIKDASIHNVNIYPPLTEKALSLTANEGYKEDYDLLKLSDISVKLCGKEKLVLVDADDKEILPLCLSLEGMSRRAKLTQFLALFESYDDTGYHLFFKSVDDFYRNEVQTIGIVKAPRFIFGKKLILKRRKWFIAKSLILNLIGNNLQDFDVVYLNMLRFLKENNIPKEVFIKIGKTDRTNDSYKPQYLNFDIPLMSLLFVDLLKKSENIIEFTEMLPTSEAVKNNGGKVKEFILNVF